MKNIGIRIKELRTQKKIKQNELAKALNVTQDSISLWERGKRIPDTQYIYSLAIYFKVTSDYLLGLEDETGEKITTKNFNNNNFNKISNSKIDIKF